MIVSLYCPKCINLGYEVDAKRLQTTIAEVLYCHACGHRATGDEWIVKGGDALALMFRKPPERREVRGVS